VTAQAWDSVSPVNVNQRFERAEDAPPAGAGAPPFRMAALTFPADKDYLALARTSAMHVAGLLDLPIGRVTDLRIAVDEACAVFLTPQPAVPSTFELCFERYAGYLSVTVRGPAPAKWPPADDELGWRMLQALVGEVRAETKDGIGTLTLIEPLQGRQHHGRRDTDSD
jgi:anti-sigma regulatory factor (Ser/Thr protein kinase)